MAFYTVFSECWKIKTYRNQRHRNSWNESPKMAIKKFDVSEVNAKFLETMLISCNKEFQKKSICMHSPLCRCCDSLKPKYFIIAFVPLVEMLLLIGLRDFLFLQILFVFCNEILYSYRATAHSSMMLNFVIVQNAYWKRISYFHL